MADFDQTPDQASFPGAPAGSAPATPASMPAAPPQSVDDIYNAAHQAYVASLASRSRFGDTTAMQEANASDQGGSAIKDVAGNFLSSLASGVGSFAHVGALAANAAGLSNESDPNSAASGMDAFGEKARNWGKQVSQDWTPMQKQVEDAAEQQNQQYLSDTGHPIQAALSAAEYAGKHPLDTAASLAGGIAPAVAAGYLTGGASTGVQIAARMAAFAASSAGNDSYDVYQKYMQTPASTLASINPEFAANPTPDNQERIARAAAMKAGIISAGINGPLTEMNSLGKLVGTSTAESAAKLVESGIANITGGGGLTAAAKIGASNPFSTIGQKVAQDVGLFSTQAAANQINQNYADQGLDPSKSLTDGVASAVGGSLPAAIVLGAHGGRGEIKEAQGKLASADVHVGDVQDLMASQGIDANSAIAQHLAAQPDAANLTDLQKLDFANYANGKIDDASVQQRSEKLSSALVDQAAASVKAGEQPDIASALAAHQEANPDMYHQGIYDRASQLGEPVQENLDAAKAAGVEADQASSFANGKDISAEYDRANPDGKMSLEDFLKGNSDNPEKDAADYKTYQDARAAQIDDLSTRVARAFNELPRPAGQDAEARQKSFERDLKEAASRVGVKDGEDFKKYEVLDAAREKINNPEEASAEKPSEAPAQEKAPASEAAPVAEEAPAAGSSSAAEETQAPEPAKPENPEEPAEAAPEAAKPQPSETPVKEAPPRNLAEAKLAKQKSNAAFEKAVLGELPTLSKGSLADAMKRAGYSESANRDKVSDWKKAIASYDASREAKDPQKRQREADMAARRVELQVSHPDVVEKVRSGLETHLEKVGKAAAKELAYDQDKAKKVGPKYDVVHSLRGEIPADRTDLLHALNILASDKWDRLRGKKTSEEGRAGFRLRTETEAAPKISPALEKLRKVNGNISAGHDISAEEVVRAASDLSGVPFDRIAKSVIFASELRTHDPAYYEERGGAAAPRPTGLYKAADRSVTIFTKGNDKDALVKTVLHEGTHRGIDTLLDKDQKGDYVAMANRFMEGNSFVSKFTRELIDSGRLKENDDYTTKFHETMAYMGEDLGNARSKMAQNHLASIFSALRSFINKVVAKIGGQELADKWVSGMSDREVLDFVRRSTNAGFEKADNWMGDRETVMTDGQPSTVFRERQADREAADKFAEKSGSFRGGASSIADSLKQAFSQPGDKISRSLDFLTNFSTKAARDETGMRQDLLGTLREEQRRSFTAKTDATKLMGLTNQMSAIYGAASDVFGEGKKVASLIADRTTKKVDKFIGMELRSAGPDGLPILHDSVSIQSVLDRAGSKYGLSAKDHGAVKEMYAGVRSAVVKSREELAKSVLRDQIEKIKDQADGDIAKRIDALSPKTDDLRNLSVDDVKRSYDAAVAVFNGQSFKDRSASRDLTKSSRAIIDKELSNLEIVRKTGWLPTYREGAFSTRAFRETTDAAGNKVQETLHYNLSNSSAKAARELAATRERFKGDSTVRVEGGTSDSTQKASVAIDNSYIERAKSIQASSLPAAEKAAQLKAASMERSLAQNALISRQHAVEDFSRGVPTGYDPSVIRSVLSHIGQESYRTGDLATAALKNRWMSLASSYDHLDNGKLRNDGRKAMDNQAAQQSKFASNVKGLMYLNYLGGSAASAFSQLAHKFILASGVNSQYDASGGAFLKSNAAQLKATMMVARGIDKLPNAAAADGVGLRDRIQAAIDAGYIQHPAYVNDAAFIADSLSSRNAVLGGAVRMAGALMASVEANDRIANWVALHDMYAKHIQADGSFDLALRKGSYWQGRFLKEGDPAIGHQPFATFADFAHHATNESFFDMNRYNKSDIERSAIGSIAMQFKMFAFHILQTASRLPLRQKAEVLGMLTMIAGTNNLPFMQNAYDLLDAAAEQFGLNIDSKKFKNEYVKSALGNDVGDIVNNGLFRQIGVDMGPRTGLGDVIPMTAALRPSNQHAQDEVLNSMGASFGYLNNLVKVYQDASSGEYRKAFLEGAPSAAANLYKGIEQIQTGQQRDLSGKNVAAATPATAAMRALGFNTAANAEFSEFRGELEQQKEQAARTSSMAAKAYARAVQSQDPTAIASALEGITNVNRQAMLERNFAAIIKPEAVRQAVQERMMGQNPNIEALNQMVMHGSMAQRQQAASYLAAHQEIGK